MEPLSPILSKPSWTENAQGTGSLEKRTRLQANSKEWQTARRKMITASIVHDVMSTGNQVIIATDV